jgi:prepilin-type N-terminal cleavage/methylation domain-containing protein
MQKGFTLIEVIIYIALFSILIGGVLVSTFQLVQTGSSLSSKTAIQNEGNFILRKIDWAFAGLDPANIPTVGGSLCNQTATTTKINYGQIVFRRDTINNALQIKEGSGGTFASTTTSNIKVTCLKFGIISGSPSGIIATTTINGIDFVITKYIRK